MSSTFCTSSACEHVDADPLHSVDRDVRRRRESSGVAYRPCTVFTTTGTPASRAASRP